MDGSGGWDEAYAKAQAFVKQLTLLEKVNLTTGVGYEQPALVWNSSEQNADSIAVGRVSPALAIPARFHDWVSDRSACKTRLPLSD